MSNIGKDVVNFLGDAVYNGIKSSQQTRIDEQNGHENQIWREAMDKQKSKDCYAAAKAFVELGLSDGQIYDFLDRYFDVSDIRKARELILTVPYWFYMKSQR